MKLYLIFMQKTVSHRKRKLGKHYRHTKLAKLKKQARKRLKRK